MITRPAPESEKDRRHDAGKRRRIVPAERLAEVQGSKHDEHHQRDRFLDDLELIRREVPYPILLAGTWKQYSPNAMRQSSRDRRDDRR